MDVKLVLIKNNGKHKMFSLSEGSTVLGRRHDCDLRIPLASVSRRHCQINLLHNSIKMRDLNSSNGTFVNGNSINETDIKAGDKIKIGPLNFILQVDGVPEEFSVPSKPEVKKSVNEESEDALSGIFDESSADSGLSEGQDEESQELDFLINED